MSLLDENRHSGFATAQLAMPPSLPNLPVAPLVITALVLGLTKLNVSTKLMLTVGSIWAGWMAWRTLNKPHTSVKLIP